MICFGVDIGGTGCKCAAYQDDGTQLAISYQEYTDAVGVDRLPPDVLWNSVCKVILNCVRALPHPEEVTAISISSFGESFVALDAQKNPIEDILLYFTGCEHGEFDSILEQKGVQHFMEITRLKPDAAYSLSKMLRIKHTADRPIWKYLFVASYVCYRLSNEVVCDETLASRSLLYDVRKHDWSLDLLEFCGISRSQLPQLQPSGSIAGPILPEAAEQLGLSRQVKIIVGAHDQVVNALGAGVSRPGDAADVTGTCECLIPLFTQIPGISFISDNFACVPYVDGLGYVTYAYNVSCGSVLKWYRDTVGVKASGQSVEAKDSLYDLLNRQCPTSPTHLIVLPYLQGMGATPNIQLSATGWITGLTTKTTLPELYRAILEGMCFEMNYNFEKLSVNDIEIDRLFACGGGANSAVWLQIKADIWGREVTPVQTKETGALGSAILAFATIENETDHCALAQRFVRHGEPIRPNLEKHAYYQKQYQTFKQLRTFCMEVCREKVSNIH